MILTDLNGRAKIQIRDANAEYDSRVGPREYGKSVDESVEEHVVGNG